MCSIRDFICRFISIELLVVHFVPFSLCKYHLRLTIRFFALSAFVIKPVFCFAWLGFNTFHTDECRVRLYFFFAVGISTRFVYTSYKFTVHKTQFTQVCTTELMQRLFKIQINLICMKYEFENGALSLYVVLFPLKNWQLNSKPREWVRDYYVDAVVMMTAHCVQLSSLFANSQWLNNWQTRQTGDINKFNSCNKNRGRKFF